jgi:hypothetical protein
VNALVGECSGLTLCDYNYMSPLHMAVREGHTGLVGRLGELGAANPNYVTYPYRETLITQALDRGYDEIARACELTPDAVRSRLHRTRLRLRQLLAAPIATRRMVAMRLSGRDQRDNS